MAPSPAERLARLSWPRVVFVGLVAAFAVLTIPTLVDKRSWTGVTISVAVTAILAYVYMSPKRIAARFLVPGTILLLAFQIYPIGYTISTAFTNYGDGHRLTQSQAVAQLEADSVLEQPGAQRYELSVATRTADTSGPFVFFLTDPNGKVERGDATGLTPVPDAQVTKDQFTGKVITAVGWHILTGIQVNGLGRRLAAFEVPVSGGFIKSVGLSEAYVGQFTMEYDAAAHTMTDTRTNTVYKASNGAFKAVDGSGKTLPIGWKISVGFKNFTSVLTDAAIRGPFLRVLVWTIAFAILSVLTTFGLGLLLAVVMDHPRMRGRRLYSSLLLLPYAMPAFISTLVWSSMYNKDFGLLNKLFGTHIDWLGSPWAARGSVLLTNLWLGFPYMFLVCAGLLQAVPQELKEVAKVDGASPFRVFRSVTMPTVLIGAMPLLIASFGYNFNNFNVIRLLTDGGPYPSGSSTAGDTDILISYTYRLAFGGQGAQYGLASAISFLIFVLVGLISYAGFRQTRQLEEVYAR